MVEQVATEKKRGGCLKWGAVAVGGLIALGVIGAALGDPATTAPGAGEAGNIPLDVTIEVIDAPTMFALFDQNEVAAKARFDGKPVRITGTVKAIQLDLFDKPQVQLSAGNQFQYVLLGFGDDAAAATGALAKGQEITVLCQEVTEVIGNPYATKCVIEGQN